MTEMSEDKIKQRQWLLAGGLLLAIVVVIAAVLFFSGADSKTNVESAIKAETVHLADASHAISPEKEWLSNAEVTLKQQSDQLKELSEQIETLKQSQYDLSAESETLKVKRGLEPQVGEDTSNQDFDGRQISQGGTLFPRVQSSSQFRQGNNNWGANPQNEIPTEPLLNKHQIALTPKPNAKNDWQEKALKNYLPTGSYAKAVILSGAMASAAVKSQADPLPVLFRITGSAVTANKQEIDLSGCTVTGEAYGDISSERAFVRLHDMTCSKNADNVIETKVEGYAAALGTGIQGKVISREGELIQSSFWSGLFGGIGQATSQASTTVSTNPLGAVETIKGEDIAKNAIGKGLATSADRVSKYHIERAEQYHAVIEVKAGREIELVFIKGVYLDGRPVEKVAGG